MNDKNETSYIFLLNRLKKGDTAAFEELYNIFSAKIYHFIKLSIKSKEDSQELTQEVFITIWKEREQINVNKSIQAFLYVIAKNKINDHLRKVLNEKKYLESVIHSYKFSDDDLQNVIDYRDTKNVIQHLIKLLPPRRRQVFELSRIKGYTYKEIAEELQISENTVDTQMRKAIAYLKEGFVNLSIYLLLLFIT